MWFLNAVIGLLFYAGAFMLLGILAMALWSRLQRPRRRVEKGA